ncbi:GDSL esterase/lipase [Trifolium repens]|nr:GDSL esterase/lipase [Trifolium repens]
MVTIEASKKNKVSAIYVFGDSTVDPGNNNYVNTAFKSDFPPYGRDLANKSPTGRFSNGKLGTDFIASYLGLKELVPPYLDPNLSDDELMTGVSFASAGSGFDPLTPTLSNVVPIQKQLEYFKQYKKRLESKLGRHKTEHHMNNALFFISAGTNDFVINYFTVPIRRRSFDVITYGHFVLQHVKDFIQNLWTEGARKIAFVGLPPMGCLPIMITFHSNDAFFQRSCVDKYSAVARAHNMILQHELFLMQLNFSNPRDHGAKISYIDIYGPLANMIQGHGLLGFDEVDRGCCGSGYIEATYMCNRVSHVCSDPSKYVFWDSIHPTEKAYHNLFTANRHILDALIKN